MEKILIAYMVQNGFGPHDYCAELIKKHGIKKVIAACEFAEDAVPTCHSNVPNGFARVNHAAEKLAKGGE
jgi:hypothetical protein